MIQLTLSLKSTEELHNEGKRLNVNFIIKVNGLLRNFIMKVLTKELHIEGSS